MKKWDKKQGAGGRKDAIRTIPDAAYIKVLEFRLHLLKQAA